MGAWGFGIWDNDTALDVRDTFDSYVNENGWTKAKALTKVKEWLEGLGYDNEDEVFALTALQMDHNIVVSNKSFRLSKMFILDNTRLADWSEPIERRKELDKFKQRIEEFEKNNNLLLKRIK